MAMMDFQFRDAMELEGYRANVSWQRKRQDVWLQACVASMRCVDGYTPSSKLVHDAIYHADICLKAFDERFNRPTTS